jgi:hypothetical protein
MRGMSSKTGREVRIMASLGKKMAEDYFISPFNYLGNKRYNTPLPAA